MLVELQHLQTLVGRLTEQLQIEQASTVKLQAQLVAQVANPKADQERAALQQQIDQLQALYARSEQEKVEWEDRYRVLEVAHHELRESESQAQQKIKAFEQNQQSVESHSSQFDQKIAELEAERDALLRKNELAKQKVEAIIHRLSMLGHAAAADSNL
jgi:chromosome segregation ATPase